MLFKYCPINEYSIKSIVENKNRFTKPVFNKIATDIITTLKLGKAPINLSDEISNFKKGKQSILGVVRKLFKDFAHTPEFRSMVDGPVKNNPYRYWVTRNSALSDQYKYDFVKSLKIVMTTGHGVDSAVIHSYLSDN